MEMFDKSPDGLLLCAGKSFDLYRQVVRIRDRATALPQPFERYFQRFCDFWDALRFGRVDIAFPLRNSFVANAKLLAKRRLCHFWLQSLACSFDPFS